MLDQLLILAEGGSHASEGVSPFLVGGGAFVILLCLLGITYLFSGLNQKTSQQSKDVAARRDSEHGRAAGTRPGQH